MVFAIKLLHYQRMRIFLDMAKPYNNTGDRTIVIFEDSIFPPRHSFFFRRIQLYLFKI